MTGSDQPGEETIAEEAAQWFARLKSLPVSRETLQQFHRWQRDARHAAAFEAVERLWQRSAALGARPAIAAATQAALARSAGGTPRSARWRPALMGVAAMGLLLLGSGISYWLLRPPLGSYATGIGQRSVVTLDDGSQVTLDTDSSVRARFTSGARQITLTRGQALFAVAHDAARPFVVTAGAAGVLATGTRFGVRRDDQAVAVTLIEGSVRVTATGEAPRVLGSGQQWVLQPGRAAVVHGVDAAATTAWTQGRLVLDGWTLARALAEVNRYTVRPIRLDAPAYASARLSGTFAAGDVESFVRATTVLLPLAATHDTDGSIRLVARASRSHGSAP